MENFNLVENLLAISPILMLTVGILLILVLEVIFKDNEKYISLFIALGSILFSIGLSYSLSQYAGSNMEFFASSIKITYIGIALSIIVLIAAFLVTLLSHAYIIKIRANYGEYYAIILLSTLGMVVIAFCNDLFTFFIGFELMSIAVYILSGINRYSQKSNEAGMKYFILGAFSTGFMLFGMSFIYGATGEVIFSEISNKLMASLNSINEAGVQINEVYFYISLVGLGLLLIGFIFKIGAVPFHSWVPDVYEGAPTNVTAFMSTAIKASAFIIIIKILFDAIPALNIYWIDILIAISLITMILGNILALVQKNIKRLLAYSGIAHTGYILAAIVAMGVLSSNGYPIGENNEAVPAVLFYLLAYMLMNIGAFACIIAFSTYEKRELENLEDIQGIAHKHKLVGLIFAISFLSLAGIPATAGFIGKLLIFKSIFVTANLDTPWQNYLYILGITGILVSILSSFYYIRVIANAYFKNTHLDMKASSYWNFSSVGFISMILIILFGIFPQVAYFLLGGYFNLVWF